MHKVNLLFLLLMPVILRAQQPPAEQDSIFKRLMLQEIHIDHQPGIVQQNIQKQRASLQASVDKILADVPGIQMIRRGSYAWEPTIRSLSAGQINVTIDGMHIFGACTDRMDPVSSYIEPNNLRQININLSPGFANYGGGIAGGLDFKMKEATVSTNKQINGLIGSAYETNARSVQTLASLGYSAPRWAIQGNVALRKAQNYRSAKNQEVPFSQYRKWNAAVAATYIINSDHRLQGSYLQDEGFDIGYPALTMDVAYAKAKLGSITHHYSHNSAIIRDLKTKFYFNKIDHAMDDSQRPAEMVPIPMDMPGKSNTYGFYSEAVVDLHPKHQVQARLSGYHNRLSAEMTMYPKQGQSMYMMTIPDGQRQAISIDLTDNIRLSDNFQLNLNSTLSHQASSIYSQVGKDQLSSLHTGESSRSAWLGNVQASLQYAINQKWQLSASAAKTSRAPTLQEYYGFYLYNRLDNYDYLGNVELSTEKSVQSTLAARFSGERLRLESSVFAYFFTDYIVGSTVSEFSAMTLGALGVKQYGNIPHARLYGAELAAQFRIHKDWNLSSINTYTRGSDQDNYSLPQIAPYRSLNRLSFLKKGYLMQLEADIHAAQNQVASERYGETRTPSSYLFHAGVQKTFSLGKQQLAANIRAENILDRSYYQHLDVLKIPRPGRNFIMSLTFTF